MFLALKKGVLSLVGAFASSWVIPLPTFVEMSSFEHTPIRRNPSTSVFVAGHFHEAPSFEWSSTREARVAIPVSCGRGVA